MYVYTCKFLLLFFLVGSSVGVTLSYWVKMLPWKNTSLYTIQIKTTGQHGAQNIPGVKCEMPTFSSPKWQLFFLYKCYPPTSIMCFLARCTFQLTFHCCWVRILSHRPTILLAKNYIYTKCQLIENLQLIILIFKNRTCSHEVRFQCNILWQILWFGSAVARSLTLQDGYRENMVVCTVTSFGCISTSPNFSIIICGIDCPFLIWLPPSTEQHNPTFWAVRH
jgi:hypothetical protein